MSYGRNSLLSVYLIKNCYSSSRNLNLLHRHKAVLSSSIRTCFYPGVKNSQIQTPLKYTRAQTFFKIIRYLWPKKDWSSRRKILLACTLLLGANVANVYVPLFFRDITNYYHHRNPEFVSTVFFFNTAGNAILTTGLCLILAYGATRAVMTVLSEIRNVLFNKVILKATRNMSTRAFRHLHALDLPFHLSIQTGALSRIVEKGIRGTGYVLRSSACTVIPAVNDIFLVSIVYWHTLGPQFTYVTLGSLGMYLLATLAITPRRTPYRHQMNKANTDANTQTLNSLINYEVIKYFNNEKFEAAKFNEFLDKYEWANQKAGSSLALLNIVQNTIFSAGLLGIMFLCAREIADGRLTVGDMVFANTFFFQLSGPLNYLGATYRDIRQGLLDTSQLLTLLNRQPKVAEKENAVDLPLDKPYSGKFDNVHFGYAEGKSILNGLNLEILPGETVAVVGLSGSGKSTMVRLLYRLYDCDSGEITSSGINLREATLSSVRQSVSLVPQTSILFQDTIHYNIAYGNPTASVDEVRKAATLAGLDPLVLILPEGYDTMIGKQGIAISREKRLRIAIARAILKKSPLLVYDEATSALDITTQAAIMKTLKAAVADKSALIIAHRLATIRDVNIIYVLEKGRAVEQGKHDELMKRNGVYAELWRREGGVAEEWR